MIVTALIVAICIAAALQPTRSRAIGAVCFAAMLVLHDLMLADADGFAYYGSAAFADLIVVALLHKLAPLSKMVLVLQRLSIVSICINAVGYVFWFAYLPAWPYNGAMIGLLALVIWVLLKDVKNVGDPSIDWRGAGLRGDLGPGGVLVQTFEGNSRC